MAHEAGQSRLIVIQGGAFERKDLAGVLSPGLSQAFGLVTEPNPALQRAIDAFCRGELTSADSSEVALQIEAPSTAARPCGGFWRRCLSRLKALGV